MKIAAPELIDEENYAPLSRDRVSAGQSFSGVV